MAARTVDPSRGALSRATQARDRHRTNRSDYAAVVTTAGADRPTTIAEVVERAVLVAADLEAVGIEVADEWQYVTDLAAAWTARLKVVSAQRGPEPIGPAVAAALEAAALEARRIADPHRAIDWLSTFPQIVLVALGERP